MKPIDMMELWVEIKMRTNALALLRVDVRELAPFEVVKLMAKYIVVGDVGVPTERQGAAQLELWIRWKEPKKDEQNSVRIEFFTQRRYDEGRDGGTRPPQRIIARSCPLPPRMAKLLNLLAWQPVADLIIMKRGPTDGQSELLNGYVFIESPNYDWDRHQGLCTQFQRELDARSNRRRRAR